MSTYEHRKTLDWPKSTQGMHPVWPGPVQWKERKGLKPSLEQELHIFTRGGDPLNIRAFKSSLKGSHIYHYIIKQALLNDLNLTLRKHRLNNSHWILSTYGPQLIILYNVVWAYMQAIKVTRHCSTSRFHMICGSWLFLCLCQQSNSLNALSVKLPWHNGIWSMCHCPNRLTHCPLFWVKVLRLSVMCISDKQHYLSWERASSQLEGWSLMGLVGEWLKEHPAL